MTISLPDSLKGFIDEQVASGRFVTVDAYVGALVEAEWKRKTQERLESLLVEGLDSGPAAEMTAQDWDDIRCEGLQRIRAKHKT